MGEKLTPKFTSDFPLLPEGIYILRSDDAKVEESKDSAKLFRVESLVEGGDHDGVKAFDNFPLVSKKSFGLERMLGFLIKLGVIDEKSEYDSDMFGTEKFEQAFKVKVPGKTYGGRIKHRKTDQGTIMGNIVEYFTVKEAQEAMKAGATGAGKGKKKEEKEKEESKKEESFF